MDQPEHSGVASPDMPISRLERRKLRTRRALVHAAQGFIAQGKLGVPILEITQAADVGMGSFYNHFSTKDELFEAALTDALDDLGAVLDSFTGSISDPAEAFAANYRLSGRLFRLRPQEAALLLAHGDSLILSNRGLSPRALRDITAAVDQGRFKITDPELGLAIAGIIGTIIGARLLVDGAIEIARDFGVAETVIGLTVVAVGTSLPELVACVIAALRRHPDVVLGNIIGSNIYNVLGILGVTAIVHPIAIPPEIAAFDIWVLLGTTLLLGLFLRTGWTLKRWEGGVFLVLYAGYVGYLTA